MILEQLRNDTDYDHTGQERELVQAKAATAYKQYQMADPNSILKTIIILCLRMQVNLAMIIIAIVMAKMRPRWAQDWPKMASKGT